MEGAPLGIPIEYCYDYGMTRTATHIVLIGTDAAVHETILDTLPGIDVDHFDRLGQAAGARAFTSTALILLDPSTLASAAATGTPTDTTLVTLTTPNPGELLLAGMADIEHITVLPAGADYLRARLGPAAA